MPDERDQHEAMVVPAEGELPGTILALRQVEETLASAHGHGIDKNLDDAGKRRLARNGVTRVHGPATGDERRVTARALRYRIFRASQAEPAIVKAIRRLSTLVDDADPDVAVSASKALLTLMPRESVNVKPQVSAPVQVVFPQWMGRAQGQHEMIEAEAVNVDGGGVEK